jgi:hypothetical protein
MAKRSETNVNIVIEVSGTIHTYPLSTVMVCGKQSHLHYCHGADSGLSGPLVIYDPFDPLRHLYDVDDGNLYYYSSVLILT